MACHSDLQLQTDATSWFGRDRTALSDQPFGDESHRERVRDRQGSASTAFLIRSMDSTSTCRSVWMKTASRNLASLEASQP